MSDQSNSTNANVTGSATDAGATQAAPQKDILDRLTDIESRLSAIESRPAIEPGAFSPAHETALARLLKTVFGETLGE